MKIKTDKKRLVLLDAHAIIHRAYHALPPDFTSPSGEPTGALYGLVSMLLKLVSDLHPDYLVACYDLPAPTVRHEAYEAYKGTRQKLDDALISQLKHSREVFEAFSIPLYDHAGFEADDIIGTIVHRLRPDASTDIIIASGDMDMLQLVSDEKVRVYTLKKGIHETVLYDEKAVVRRFGFPPALIPDYKGLRGDPSDNLAGVPGIGEKTATALMSAFGSIDDIYRAIAKDEKNVIKKGFTARTVSLLKEHEEDARFSKALATIRTDAPIAFQMPDTLWREAVALKDVLALFDRFGFRSLKERARLVIDPDRSESDEDEADPDIREEPVDDTRFREAQVMLWLIASDFTDPSRDDILAFTKERTFDAAYASLETRLKTLGRVQEVYARIEKPLIPVIEKMEAHGVLIDPSAITKLSKRYTADLSKLEKRIYKSAGAVFNISSPKQLGEILFDKLALIPERQKKTSGGQRSTRESELEKIKDRHPIVPEILEYRELKKLLSTYIENMLPLLDASHRLHARFVQTGTSTGRMSSQDPNLQNIPLHSERGKAIRYAFIAPEHFSLLSLDYSQIELRLAAILSGDERLCAIFKDGRDVHQEVAAMVFGVGPDDVTPEMRRRAKIINFGILYGMGANALKQQLGSTLSEAHQFLDDYFRTFSTLSEYLERTKGFARKHGYTETLFGRRRLFPEMKSPLPYVRAQAERMAINAPIQGTQADLIKLVMVECDRMIAEEKAEHDAYLLLQVHDELVYEIKTERLSELGKRIKDIMQSVLPTEESRGVPVITSAKAGPDWGSMTEMKI